MSVMLEGTFREAAPLHFLFKIKSFFVLSKNSIVKYEANEFQTAGFEWKLSMYPDGNKNENGIGHISLYLELVDKYLGDCWQMHVSFKLFLFDRIRERYFIRGGNPVLEMKRVWGFPQFVSLAEFNDPANGYLVDDTCLFGAEVFVSKPPGNTECLSMIKQSNAFKHTWKIENFSSKSYGSCYTEKFIAGGHKWNLVIYPRGNSHATNYSVSLYLSSEDCQNNGSLKICTHFKLRLRDQFNGKNLEFSTGHWFSYSSKIFGCENFIGLGEMKDTENGYLVNDTCIVEAEVEVLGVVSIL